MNPPARGEMLYEGKAKRMYATPHPEELIVEYKDDATAFNALKRGSIAGKGAVNNAVSAKIFGYLAAAGIPTHFLGLLSEREQLVRQVRIVPIEVIVRNRAAGSFAKRYGVEEGGALEPVVVEWCYKNDELGDPFLNDAAAVALGIATAEELETLFELAVDVNEALKPFFAGIGLDLVDFKLEFGRSADGEIVLADEISPDTCRLWDATSGEKLDKDRFRRDLGGVEEAYQEVRRRVLAAPDASVAGAHHDHDDDHDHPHEHPHDHAHGEDGAGSHSAVVDVMLKRSILDPQGRAVEATLRRLGHANVSDLRVGKRIELRLAGSREAVERQLGEIAGKVLSNPVMEEYTVELATEGD